MHRGFKTGDWASLRQARHQSEDGSHSFETRRRVAPFVLTAVALAMCGLAAPSLAQSPTFGLGRTPDPAEIKRLDIDVAPDGRGLPVGSGTADLGKKVYELRCVTCHGATGKEGPQEILVGGQGTLNTAKPIKTIGSYWPYATTLWDYVNRSMPFDHPGTLPPDEGYSVTAFLLPGNGIIGERDVLAQSTLPKVKMPNRGGFVPDARPDVGARSTAPNQAPQRPAARQKPKPSIPVLDRSRSADRR